MEAYRIQNKSVRLIFSYLTHWKQYVSNNNTFITYKEIALDLPLSSILGVTSFMLYIFKTKFNI